MAPVNCNVEPGAWMVVLVALMVPEVPVTVNPPAPLIVSVEAACML